MPTRRDALQLLGSAVVGGTLAGRARPAMAAPDTLTIGLPGDFPRLDPSKDTSPLGFNFRLNVFDALTEMERNGEVHPRLATKWSFSPDLTEWTFTLRQGVKFHDGSPFTAADVVWTVQRILNDPTTPVRTFLKIAQGVEAIDDHTVRFKLIQPYGIFDRQMTYISMMSKTYFDKAGDKSYDEHPVGTGPYSLVRWVKDDRTELRANPNYWNGAPAYKSAVFRPIPSDASRAAALLSGEVDLVPALAPALLKQLGSSPDLKVGIAPGFRVIFLAFNVNVPPLDNPMRREAIDRAIDRESLTKNLLRGLGKPTGIMVPPMNIGYDASFKPTPYDPDAARKLVQQSGYTGKPILLQYPNNNLVMADEVAQAVAGYLNAVGIKIALRPMEFTAFFPAWLQDKLQEAYLFAFGATSYHAESILTTLYEKGSHGFKIDDRIDHLLKQQRTVTDPVEQKKLLSEAFRDSNEDRYEIPLYDELQAYAERKTVNYDPWPDGFVRLYDLK
jgi:peptide/nickel transport system substrate-binding protein